jgi:hypothetical protein
VFLVTPGNRSAIPLLLPSLFHSSRLVSSVTVPLLLSLKLDPRYMSARSLLHHGSLRLDTLLLPLVTRMYHATAIFSNSLMPA